MNSGKKVCSKQTWYLVASFSWNYCSVCGLYSEKSC